MIDFNVYNINDHCRVQLTEFGIEELKREDPTQYANNVDKSTNVWSTQIFRVMSVFGKTLFYWCQEQPFAQNTIAFYRNEDGSTCAKVVNNLSKEIEPHPAIASIKRWLYDVGLGDLACRQKLIASHVSEENKALCDTCGETLNRLIKCEPVSDTDLLGLAWGMTQLSPVITWDNAAIH